MHVRGHHRPDGQTVRRVSARSSEGLEPARDTERHSTGSSRHSADHPGKPDRLHMDEATGSNPVLPTESVRPPGGGNYATVSHCQFWRLPSARGSQSTVRANWKTPGWLIVTPLVRVAQGCEGGAAGLTMERQARAKSDASDPVESLRRHPTTSGDSIGWLRSTARKAFLRSVSGAIDIDNHAVLIGVIDRQVVADTVCENVGRLLFAHVRGETSGSAPSRSRSTMSRSSRGDAADRQ